MVYDIVLPTWLSLFNIICLRDVIWKPHGYLVLESSHFKMSNTAILWSWLQHQILGGAVRGQPQNLWETPKWKSSEMILSSRTSWKHFSWNGPAVHRLQFCSEVRTSSAGIWWMSWGAQGRGEVWKVGIKTKLRPVNVMIWFNEPH